MNTRTSLHSFSWSLSVLVIVAAFSAVGYAQESRTLPTAPKYVEIASSDIEFLGVDTKGLLCSKQLGPGRAIQLRVVSASAVDVRIYAEGQQGRWQFKDYRNQTADDKINYGLCWVGARFVVFTRPAGTTDAWPSPTVARPAR